MITLLKMPALFLDKTNLKAEKNSGSQKQYDRKGYVSQNGNAAVPFKNSKKIPHEIR